MPRLEPASLTARDGTVRQINPYAGVLAHRPEILRKWGELSDTVRFSGVLPAELKEEMRRSTATLVGCEFCASLGEPKAEYTDPREAAAVAFAKTVAEDHRRVDEQTFAELREHFSDEEIVELVATACFVIMGGQTFGNVMGIESASDEDALAYEQWREDRLAGAAPSSAG
jgi:alkylhydroperoxidase family enzyme